MYRAKHILGWTAIHSDPAIVGTFIHIITAEHDYYALPCIYTYGN